MLIKTLLCELKDGESVRFWINSDTLSVSFNVRNRHRGLTQDICVLDLTDARRDVLADELRSALEKLRAASR